MPGASATSVFHAAFRRMLQRDGHQPEPRRVLVGQHVERLAVVADHRVAGVESVEERLDRAAGLAEVADEDAVAVVGPLGLRDEQKAAVLGDIRPEAPVGLVRPLVDQRVLLLQRAQLVEEDLLVLVERLERLALRLVVAAVVEAGAVLEPGGAAELGPLHEIRQVLRRRDLAHVPLDPVGPARRERVGHVAAVLGERDAAQRHRPVLRQRVGIDQHLGRRRERLRLVNDGLRLQTAVLREDVPGSLARRRAEALVIPQFRQARLDRCPLGDLRQVVEGDRVLGVNPGAGLGRVGVLEPPVGIGHLDTEEGVNLGALVRDGIGRFLGIRLGGEHGHGNCDGDEQIGLHW